MMTSSSSDGLTGMIASCEMSARALDQDFNSAEHRERIRTGDLSIEDMQEFTDELRIERDERERGERSGASMTQRTHTSVDAATDGTS